MVLPSVAAGLLVPSVGAVTRASPGVTVGFVVLGAVTPVMTRLADGDTSLPTTARIGDQIATVSSRRWRSPWVCGRGARAGLVAWLERE